MSRADNRDTHAVSLGGGALRAVPREDQRDPGLGKVENREDYPGEQHNHDDLVVRQYGRGRAEAAEG
jgi:hypothetical protein